MLFIINKSHVHSSLLDIVMKMSWFGIEDWENDTYFVIGQFVPHVRDWL